MTLFQSHCLVLTYILGFQDDMFRFVCRCINLLLNYVVFSGYGFVRFGSESEQKRSMSEMQGARGCGGKAIRVSAATPKK